MISSLATSDIAAATFNLRVSDDGSLRVFKNELGILATRTGESGGFAQMSGGWNFGSIITPDTMHLNCNNHSCPADHFGDTDDYAVTAGNYSFSAFSSSAFSCEQILCASNCVTSCSGFGILEGRGEFFVLVRYFQGDFCDGDATGDSCVGAADLAAVLGVYGASIRTGCDDPSTDYNPDADVTGDGSVDQADLSLVLTNYNTSCNSASCP